MRTLKQAAALLQQHNMVIRNEDGGFTVNYRHGSDATAEYSTSLNEVVELALAKAERQEARQAGKRMKALHQWAMASNGQV